MSTINPASALSAYSNAAKTGAAGSGGALDLMANKAIGSDGPSFGDVLKSATQKTIDTQKVAEKASADAVLGKADLTDVVNAVNNAEVTLNMFMAVRDKMIEAYDKISRTQI